MRRIRNDYYFYCANFYKPSLSITLEFDNFKMINSELGLMPYNSPLTKAYVAPKPLSYRGVFYENNNVVNISHSEDLIFLLTRKVKETLLFSNVDAYLVSRSCAK